MVVKNRYYQIPLPLVDEQKINPLTRDLYFTEIGEIEINPDSIWDSSNKLENNLLAFCTKGNGIVILSGEQIPVSNINFSLFQKERNLNIIL